LVAVIKNEYQLYEWEELDESKAETDSSDS
jgi:hypothetical protein